VLFLLSPQLLLGSLPSPQGTSARRALLTKVSPPKRWRKKYLLLQNAVSIPPFSYEIFESSSFSPCLTLVLDGPPLETPRTASDEEEVEALPMCLRLAHDPT